MCVADVGFDDATVVNVKQVFGELEDSVTSDILLHYLAENFNRVYVNGEEPVKFSSKEEMINNYWKTLLDNK